MMNTLPDTAPGAPGQLYNLEIDPGETRNLYFDQAQIVGELKIARSIQGVRTEPA